MATALIGLLGHEARVVAQSNYVTDALVDLERAPATLEYEEQLASSIASDDAIPETERQAIVIARRGQGKFKKNVQQLECRCRITGVDRLEHLIASHCKPWRDCETNHERLDGENGLLLTPSIDHLFDRGFISFEGDGRLLVSPVAHNDSLTRMGVSTSDSRNVGAFSSGQRQYLEFHRESVFLQANLG